MIWLQYLLARGYDIKDIVITVDAKIPDEVVAAKNKSIWSGIYE